MAAKKKILVTGAGGYIGTDLIRELLLSNFEVIAIDRFYFGLETVKEFYNNSSFHIVKKDSRSLSTEDFQGVWAVVDLVSISNDPSGEIDKELTNSINNIGRVNTAKMARASGVERYVLSSSCSVYGDNQDQDLKEDSKANPLTTYAKSAYEAELGVLGLSTANFNVTVIRNATVFGLSNRMRFDLVINLMVWSAFENKKIVITGGGNQWRPLVHVNDVSLAILMILAADTKKTKSEIFNIGSVNIQVKTLAYRVRERLPFRTDIELILDDPDKRNYNVNFNKASQLLGFTPQKTIEDGIDEIYSALVNGKVYKDEKSSTLNWYQRLRETEKLYKELNMNGQMF